MKCKIPLLIALASGALLGHSYGPDPRYTGAPGDDPNACTACHRGTALNAGGGSVAIILPGDSSYTPGVKQHIKVQVSDSAQMRWGFQLTARLASDSANAQAGDFTPADGSTQVLCQDSAPKPCSANAPLQFIEHTTAGSSLGTPNGHTFEFDWTPPATDQGDVILYAAGNAANGNGAPTGDHIYTTNVQLRSTGGGGGGQAVSAAALATRYVTRNLVSDIPGLADHTDPQLVNPWGISMSATGPFWVSNNGKASSTLYDGTGQLFPTAGPLVVAVAGKGKGAPTGQVFNGTKQFELTAGKPAQFIFASEDGTISAWNSTVDAANAAVMVDNSSAGAVYKGLAMGIGATPFLYAANFSAGTVDVFDGNFQPVAVAGGFTDPNLPAGFAPFNILRCGSRLLVAYAKQGDAKRDDVAGPGNGFIDVFDTDGNLKKRLVSQGPLNSPWGMAIAPAFFGDYSGMLLVGNFGNGWINAFDLTTGESGGPLRDGSGNPIVVQGLWALQAGNGKTGGDSNTVYFTAGIAGDGAVEDHGLLGSIQVAPNL